MSETQKERQRRLVQAHANTVTTIKSKIESDVRAAILKDPFVKYVYTEDPHLGADIGGPFFSGLFYGLNVESIAPRFEREVHFAGLSHTPVQVAEKELAQAGIIRIESLSNTPPFNVAQKVVLKVYLE